MIAANINGLEADGAEAKKPTPFSNIFRCNMAVQVTDAMSIFHKRLSVFASVGGAFLDAFFHL